MIENADSYFKQQQRMEDLVTLKATIIQVSINFGIAIIVLILFSWLRPRYPFIYAPKEKLIKSDVRRPVTLGSGWFDWIKPIAKIKDDALIENIGFDGYVFIYFTRILRRLIIVLTLLSMFILLPVNIVATYNTGDWPPVGLEFLSISAMNYQYGKASVSSNHLWYWAPTTGTWIFSIIITYQMVVSSTRFILFRQQYYIRKEETTKTRLPSMSPIELVQQQKQELISRTLLVHIDTGIKPPIKQQPSVPDQQYIIPNQYFKTLVDSHTPIPCQQLLVGKHNNKANLLIKDYNKMIKLLERHLNRYLCQVKEHQQKLQQQDIPGGSTAIIQRPQVRVKWNSKRVDAIDYYTEKSLVLDAAIKRNRSRLRNNSYGWVVYPSKSVAHQAYLTLEKKLKSTTNNKAIERVRLAPHPDDIVWTNMNIDSHTGQLKRWFGYGLFISILFTWSIPVAVLAVTSNMINMIRMFPKSADIINENQLIMGIIQSYFTPCLMVLFFIGLPTLLRFISRQQAYKTETVLQQKILAKLYTFFVVNNLFIFTLVSIMVGIVGQVTALTIIGTLKSKNLSQYIVQIAKNMSDVSTFWISYVCIRSVGIIFELLQFAPLLWIIVLRGKGMYNYTPRQLDRAIGAPPYFDFAKNYGLVISFFTAALVYSVSAPIVLPFALVYFGLATTIYKYKLMYIYVTKVETHGMIWPMLYSIVMISLVVFQCIMILMLSLKAGIYQIYALIPLPIITTIILVCYTRHLLKHNTLKTWIELNSSIRPSLERNVRDSLCSSSSSTGDDIEMTQVANSAASSIDQEEDSIQRDARLINNIYRDPSLHDPLWKPMLFDDIKHLVPDVYKDHPQRNRIFATLYSDEDTTKEQPLQKTSTTPATEETNPIEEKQKLKQQLELEMSMYPPTPLHSEPSSSYYRYYEQRPEMNQGSSSQRHLMMYDEPEEDVDRKGVMVDPTAPSLDMFQPEEEALFQPAEEEDESIVQHHYQPPPPNYADVVSPRVNTVAQLDTQTTRPPIRRHSIS